MLLLIGCADEYIAEVTYSEVVNVRLSTIVNISLTCSRCICQPKGYNSVFELTIAASECSLEHFAFIDPDEVVHVPEVQFSEDPGFVHSIE